jgi:hypothetical protein
MKLKQAMEVIMNEDVYWDLVHDAFEVYKAQGGTVLDAEEYLRFHKKGLKPWHIARKEKDIKGKSKKSNEIVRKKLYDYFFSRKT